MTPPLVVQQSVENIEQVAFGQLTVELLVSMVSGRCWWASVDVVSCAVWDGQSGRRRCHTPGRRTVCRRCACGSGDEVRRTERNANHTRATCTGTASHLHTCFTI